MTPEYASHFLFGFSYGLGVLSVIISWYQMPKEDKTFWSFATALFVAFSWLAIWILWVIKKITEALWSAAKCLVRFINRIANKRFCWIRRVYRVFWDFPMYWQTKGCLHEQMPQGYWDGVRAWATELLRSDKRRQP